LRQRRWVFPPALLASGRYVGEQDDLGDVEHGEEGG
jgi:hypothetical protein